MGIIFSLCLTCILAEKSLETNNKLRYNIKTKESTHSKVDAYRMLYFPLNERRPFRLQTGWALFFSLISLIEKGKQRNDQSP
jgi:hypothetical protein